MQERTSEEDRAFLAGFQARLTVDIEGLVRTLFTHGSPRSDEEIVTYATPERRMRALLEGVEERVLVTAHTHLQFDREVVGIRSINAGSVGLPYEGRPGAYWALLGPDVELRRCVEHVLRTRGPAALGYAPRAGLPRLRELVARDLCADGVPATPDEVMITTGSQQGLDLLFRALVDPGDTFLVDESTYAGAVHILASAGAHAVEPHRAHVCRGHRVPGARVAFALDGGLLPPFRRKPDPFGSKASGQLIEFGVDSVLDRHRRRQGRRLERLVRKRAAPGERPFRAAGCRK